MPTGGTLEADKHMAVSEAPSWGGIGTIAVIFVVVIYGFNKWRK